MYIHFPNRTPLLKQVFFALSAAVLFTVSAATARAEQNNYSKTLVSTAWIIAE